MSAWSQHRPADNTDNPDKHTINCLLMSPCSFHICHLLFSFSWFSSHDHLIERLNVFLTLCDQFVEKMSTQFKIVSVQCNLLLIACLLIVSFEMIIWTLLKLFWWFNEWFETILIDWFHITMHTLLRMNFQQLTVHKPINFNEVSISRSF